MVFAAITLTYCKNFRDSGPSKLHNLDFHQQHLDGYLSGYPDYLPKKMTMPWVRHYTEGQKTENM